MKVLTITANDNSLGGASRVAMDIHQQLIRFGHDSFVFTGKKETESDLIEEIKRPLWRRIASKILSNDIDFFDTDYILSTEQFLDADIIHCHNLSGWYFNLGSLKKMTKLKPVVWTLHDMWAVNPHSGYTSSTKITNGIYEVSDSSFYPTNLWNNDKYLSYKKTYIYKSLTVNIVSPCHWLSNLVSHTSLGRNPIDIIYNGVDTNIFALGNKISLKSKLGFNSSPMMLFIGASATKSEYKGFADFLWLSRQDEFKHIQFVCLGSERDEIIDNLRYVKATPFKKSIAEYLSAADLFILPSRFETFPLVVIEALSCGTPVVAYDVGGVSEALQDAPFCKLVKQNEKDELLLAVRNTLSELPKFTNLISNKLRELALNKFSMIKIVENYIYLYQRIIDSRNRNQN